MDNIWRKRCAAAIIPVAMILFGRLAYGQNIDRHICSANISNVEACEIFTDVKSLLPKSIIPKEVIDRIWTEKKFSDAMRGHSPILAAKTLLGEFGTSHTGIFFNDETQYFDLIAITQYSNGPPDEAVKSVFGSENPSYPGIGAWYALPQKGRGFIITQIFPNSPAAVAGLLPGDEVVDVGGRPFAPISSIAGKIGGSVEMGVRRRGRLLKISLHPMLIEPLSFYRSATLASVKKVEIGGRQIGYIRPYAFYQSRDMDDLQKLLTAGPFADVQGVVLDLRGGWGGTPIHFANPFVGGLPQQEIEGSNGYKRNFNWNFCKPVAVVVDRSTRSGKEIFARTLQINKIPIVGERTSGDVLSTRASLIASGRAILELPLADVKIGGVRLEKRGVEPDISVSGDLQDHVVISAAVAAMNFAAEANRRPVCSSA